MGRRKIDIEPITQERTRTVTFIKRKAGLFKKAHELAVLCQVDVAVLILGHNNTFYEFSSVDTDDLIRHYQSDKLVHDVKEPSDFGDYQKKDRVVLRPTKKRSGGSNKNAASTTSNPASARKTPGPSSVESTAVSDSARPMKRRLRSTNRSSYVSNRALSDNEDDPDGSENEDDQSEADEEDEDEDAEGNESSSTSSSMARKTGTKRTKKNFQNINSAAQASTSSQDQSRHLSSVDQRNLENNMNIRNVNSTSPTSLNSMSTRQSPFMDIKQPSFSKQPTLSANEPNAGLKFNPLQEHVQRQFHNLYNSKEPRMGTPVIQPQMVNSGFSRSSISNVQDRLDAGSKVNMQSPMTALRTMLANSNTPSPTEETAQGDRSTHQNHTGPSRVMKQYQPQRRPVLRVEIPTSNITAPIKSEGDSASSDAQPKSANDTQRTPSNTISQSLASSPVIGDKPRSAGTSGTNNGYLYNGLISGFVASPSVQQYFATPLQAQNNATPMLQMQNPQNYLMQRQLQYAQQQHQLQQQRTQLNQQQNGRNSIQASNMGDQNSGPLTGSLPSKFAHDLIVQSPNTSIGGMFQEWPFPPNATNSGRGASTLPHLQMNQQHQLQNVSQAQRPGNSQLPQHQQHNQSDLEQSSAQQMQQQQNIGNGTPGLSPYINVNQTPTSKTFNIGETSSTNFPSEMESEGK